MNVQYRCEIEFLNLFNKAAKKIKRLGCYHVAIFSFYLLENLMKRNIKNRLLTVTRLQQFPSSD